jgi:uncharacterized membrane protein YeaQ/YmgE (transglycosylase-associated protein family)
MGFLAFLLIGGISGASTWIFYPGNASGLQSRKLLIAILLGFVAAFLSSYVGQYAGLFQSGQMVEWLSAILGACVVGWIYTALFK